MRVLSTILRTRSFAVLVVVLLSISTFWWVSHRGSRNRVSFSRDIQPILNQNCVQCHGGVRQKNGVSFIYREEALGTGKSGRRTIVPGHPEQSELIARVTSSDPEARMPYHSPPLLPQQLALLRQWIQEGAEWEEHWAFVAPKPQVLPIVKQTSWIRRPLDRFILARLENEGLAPSAEADKAALLRRVTFLLPWKSRLRSLTIRRRMRTRNRWSGCWLPRIMGSVGQRYGWIWRATRTAKAMRQIEIGPEYGRIAIG
jgi:hypothetical protein